MRLVFGGFALQTCNPTFITARDAILLADEHYYGGENKCLIWKAFAKRGLGVDTTIHFIDNYDLPRE
jgi:extracellular elastinolytic metalloproteinase